jgi:hypothetical protein
MIVSCAQGGGEGREWVARREIPTGVWAHAELTILLKNVSFLPKWRGEYARLAFSL